MTAGRFGERGAVANVREQETEGAQGADRGHCSSDPVQVCFKCNGGLLIVIVLYSITQHHESKTPSKS